MTRRHVERYGDPRHERTKDPLEILIARERGTCKGCRLILKSPFGGPEVACKKRMRPAALRIEETKRCMLYTLEEAK